MLCIFSWPQLSEIFDKNNLNCDWYAEVKYVCNLKSRISQILSLMTSRQQPFSDSDFREWLELYQEKPQTYYYLINDLMIIVHVQISINNMDAVPLM